MMMKETGINKHDVVDNCATISKVTPNARFGFLRSLLQFCNHENKKNVNTISELTMAMHWWATLLIDCST